MLAGCDSLPGRPTQADLPLRPTNVTDFATLYGENCAGCHGADGKSGAAIAMNNPVYLAIIDDASMRRVIANGVPGTAMPPFAQSAGGSLTDHQIDILIARHPQKLGGRCGCWPQALRPTPVPRQAIQIVARKCIATNCQSCHGRDGKGGTGGSVVDPSYLALVSDQYLRTIVIAGRPELGHPDWKNAAARTAADAATGLRRRRMARIETSRVTFGTEQLKWTPSPEKTIASYVFCLVSE